MMNDDDDDDAVKRENISDDQKISENEKKKEGREWENLIIFFQISIISKLASAISCIQTIIE